MSGWRGKQGRFGVPLLLAALAFLFAGLVASAPHDHQGHDDAAAPCDVCTVASVFCLGEPPEDALPHVPAQPVDAPPAVGAQPLSPRCLSAHAAVRGPPAVRA